MDEKKREALISRKREKEELFVKVWGDHWYCKNVDTWVSLSVNTIPAIDKVNTYLLFNGLNPNSVTQPVLVTLLGRDPMPTPYTIEEYHEVYCRYDRNLDKWVYNVGV
jgi:hypothetical protein